MMDSLKLTLFGSPHVELDGIPVRFKTRKALALLAYVAVTNQVHSRETLATLFWSEFSSDRAFANLREALWSLKQLLTDRWLTIQRYDVAIRADTALWVNVHEFQRHLDHADDHSHAQDMVCADCLPSLMTAIDLYQDDFLHGFTLPDCPGFDEWHAFQTDLFREKLISSFTRIIHYATASQQYAQAVQYARQWVRLCSGSEEAHRELMRLYVLDNQQSKALQQYQDCARMLQEEFGAEPEQQTTELYESILHQTQPSDGRGAVSAPTAGRENLNSV